MGCGNISPSACLLFRRKMITLQLETKIRMMLRKLTIPTLAALGLAGLVACNSDDDYHTVEETASAAVVRSFSLAGNDSVMADLDSVFFAIDLEKYLIFNADSLPYGTNVTALTPQITTLEGAALIEMTVTRDGKADTTIAYNADASQKIDFTHPVKLRVLSPDRLTDRTYTVSVNVHRMVADTLAWDRKGSFPMPSPYRNVAAARSACDGTDLYTLSTDGTGAYALFRYEGVDDMGNRYLNSLPSASRTLSPDFVPVVESFCASADGTLYLLDTAGTLHRSTDLGSTWTPAAQTGWTSVIGAYGTEILGIARRDGAYRAVSTDGLDIALPHNMPVSGFSMPVENEFPMATSAQLLILGGVRADGTLCADAWGYDGSTWVCISKRPLPAGMEGVTVAKYYTIRGTGISAREVQALLAFGGRMADGKINTSTYISVDNGFNWSAAPVSLLLPDHIPAMYSAQAFVFDTTHSAVILPQAPARISRPVETWQTPYIYLYGGRDGAGVTVPEVWRGVINSLSFKPVI